MQRIARNTAFLSIVFALFATTGCQADNTRDLNFQKRPDLLILLQLLTADDSVATPQCQSGFFAAMLNSSGTTNTYYLWSDTETTCPVSGSGALFVIGTVNSGSREPTSGYTDWGDTTSFFLSSTAQAGCSVASFSIAQNSCLDFEHTGGANYSF